ncbi:unnamed protein product [marine sediment metagenome]|uniref:Uncharacterized protein n=1 Tax=marine sediment metagenome TaxID=412755 RepID=X0ZU44_9ZZZZ
MLSRYQERIFLSLHNDDNNQIKIAKDILKSPLGLASELIKLLFERKLEELKYKLDKIKYFAGGISRAEKLYKSSKYSLASYYPNMFTFHQFFHSSYRARQGKVLEKIIKYILLTYTECDNVPETSNKSLGIINSIFGKQFPNLDIDALGCDSGNKKSILIQLRSRDDTGGTTAKGSLVDLLEEMLELNKAPSYNILYLVSIWDARNSQQKKSTIRKIYSRIKNSIDINEYGDFESNILGGVKLKKNITLKLAYGDGEIVNAIFAWSKKKDKAILKSIPKIIFLIENWDDLWISYSIANLELEIKSLYGYSNITLIENKYKKVKKNFNFNSYQELVNSIDDITTQLVSNWFEDSIPLNSPADKAHYIRDLLFLKACYEKSI